MKWLAAALVALTGSAAAVGLLIAWLAMHGPAEYTGWVTLGSFGLAAFSIYIAALITGAPVGED